MPPGRRPVPCCPSSGRVTSGGRGTLAVHGQGSLTIGAGRGGWRRSRVCHYPENAPGFHIRHVSTFLGIMELVLDGLFIVLGCVIGLLLLCFLSVCSFHSRMLPAGSAPLLL